MIFGIKYRLYPSVEDERPLGKYLALSRWMFNMALGMEQRQHAWHLGQMPAWRKKGELVEYGWLFGKDGTIPPKPQSFLSAFDLSNKITTLRQTHPWLQDIPVHMLQAAAKNVVTAFKNFFEGRASYPNFKKQGRDEFSCSQNCQVNLRRNGRKLYLAVTKKMWLEVNEHTRLPIEQVKSFTISRKNKSWHVSFIVDDGTVAPEPYESTKNDAFDEAVGEYILHQNNGRSYGNPQAWKCHQKKIGKMQQILARKQKGSNNAKKLKAKIAREHEKVANTREYRHKKLAYNLVGNARERKRGIAWQDLDYSNMIVDNERAPLIADAGLGMLFGQMSWQAEKQGVPIFLAPRYTLSTQTCSKCDYVLPKEKRLDSSVLKWTCPSCKTNHDRNTNSANVIDKYSIRRAVVKKARAVKRSRKGNRKKKDLKIGTDSKSAPMNATTEHSNDVSGDSKTVSSSPPLPLQAGGLKGDSFPCVRSVANPVTHAVLGTVPGDWSEQSILQRSQHAPPVGDTGYFRNAP